jgi:hypothetical protein
MLRVNGAIALEEFGMTFRQEEGEWVSYPTNTDGTCDFYEGAAVLVGEWEQSTPEEIERVQASLTLIGKGAAHEA